MISTVGFLVGAELELGRLEGANSTPAEQLQTRKIVERAKGILQRDLGLNEERAYLACNAEPPEAQAHEGDCRSDRVK